MNKDMRETKDKKSLTGAVRLSARLMAVAGFVEPGSCIADIGTDHGYIPVYLAQTGRIQKALAMDVRSGPLLRAQAHVKEYETRAGERREASPCPIETRLSDGLAELKPGEADTVIIAGMGGELIMKILDRGRHLWDSVRHYILSPQSDLDKVRRYLAAHGFVIKDEAMVKEDGKYYTVMSVKRGFMEYDSQAHYLYGRILIRRKDRILKEFLHKETHRIETIMNSLEEKKDVPETKARAEARRSRLNELSWIKEAQDEMQ